MRHRQSRFNLNRFTSWRKATLASLARSIIIYQSIRTTKVKAQAVKPLIDKLISLAKANTLQAKRRAYKILNDHKLVALLFSDIGPRFAKRTGGYTRMLNLETRRGDGADMVLLELTEIKKKERKHPKKEKEAKPEEGKIEGEEVQQPEEPVHGHKAEEVTKEKPSVSKKPSKKFLGGIRNIFKKERDSL